MKNFFWKTDQLPYVDQIKQLERELKRADAVIIGAGVQLRAACAAYMAEQQKKYGQRKINWKALFFVAFPRENFIFQRRKQRRSLWLRRRNFYGKANI